MLTKSVIAIATLAVGFGLASLRGVHGQVGTKPEAASYLNFEIGAGPDGIPTGWGGGGPSDYRRSLDNSNPHSGSGCGKIEALKPTPLEFATFTSFVNPKEYLGRKVRYTGWLKSKGITNGWAGMWLRIDGAGWGKILGFDNMSGRPVTGTTDWKQYTIELDVPKEAKSIIFGFLLAGYGTLWGDDFKLEPVGKPVAIAPIKVTVPPAAIAAIKKQAIPLSSVKAGSGFNDLEPIGRMVGDARIVALGEASHGTAEFFQMKHRLLEYLVEKKGFTVFAIEGNFPESQVADRYIKTGEGSPEEALASMYFWTWQTEEVRDMLKWMRAYNQRPGKHAILSFSGFDMQTPDVAAQEAAEQVAKISPEAGKRIHELYQGIGQPPRARRGPKPAKEAAQLREKAKSAEKLIEESKQALIARNGMTGYLHARQCARVVTQSMTMMAPDGSSNTYDVRDYSMALNVKWLAEQAYPGQKIVLWAHNGHVSKGNYGGPSRSMGSYLHEMFGNRMFVMGFASHHGAIRAIRMKNGQMQMGGPVEITLAEPAGDGVEAAFGATKIPLFALDLRSIKPGTWLSQPHPHRMPGAVYDPDNDLSECANVALPSIYDGIIFSAQSTAAKPLELFPH